MKHDKLAAKAGGKTDSGGQRGEYTPGPWHAYDRGIGWEVHSGAECSNTCDCINEGFRDTFTEADARLIAAAPELLDACQAVKKFLGNLETGIDPDDPLLALRRKFHGPLLAKLDPAIAKATSSALPASTDPQSKRPAKRKRNK